MSNQPDTNNRLKGLRIPIETCVRFERLAGVKVNEEPTIQQKKAVAKMMVSAMILASQHVQLNAADHEQIAREVAENERKLKITSKMEG